MAAALEAVAAVVAASSAVAVHLLAVVTEASTRARAEVAKGKEEEATETAWTAKEGVAKDLEVAVTGSAASAAVKTGQAASAPTMVAVRAVEATVATPAMAGKGSEATRGWEVRDAAAEARVVEERAMLAVRTGWEVAGRVGPMVAASAAAETGQVASGRKMAAVRAVEAAAAIEAVAGKGLEATQGREAVATAGAEQAMATGVAGRAGVAAEATAEAVMETAAVEMAVSRARVETAKVAAMATGEAAKVRVRSVRVGATWAVNRADAVAEAASRAAAETAVEKTEAANLAAMAWVVASVAEVTGLDAWAAGRGKLVAHPTRPRT